MEHCLIISFLSINSWTDIRKRQISLLSVGIFALIGLAYQGLYKKQMSPALLGLMPGILLLAVSKVTREALGMGDALLMLVLGIFLGLPDSVEVLLLSLFLAAFWAGILMIICRRKRDYEFPFVPFLLLGYIGRILLCTW